MKTPVVIVHLRNGLVSSVEVEESPFQPMTDGNLSESINKALELNKSVFARNQQPTLPLSPSQLPHSKENGTENYLSILDKEISSPAHFILHDEMIEGVNIPERLPADSSYITMAERGWPEEGEDE